jgi:ring-1,2-phenylacetyl-CoA epoxidase subunit PaaD
MCGAELISRDEAEARAWAALREVMDPEVPVLSLVDLGVVRAVHLQADAIEIVLTPTYSGCPATEVIAEQAQAAVAALGLDHRLDHRHRPRGAAPLRHRAAGSLWR